MNLKAKILKYPKEILIIFAILDAMIVGKSIKNVPYLIRVVAINWWSCTMMVLYAVGLLSLTVSAFGLACQKKWAFVLYYCQLPFRCVFCWLSFIFILRFIPQGQAPVSTDWIYLYTRPVIIIAVILEMVRLLMTIIIHKNSNKIVENI